MPPSIGSLKKVSITKYNNYLVNSNEAYEENRIILYFNTKTIYKVAESEGVSTEAINKHMNRTKIRLVLDSINYLDETVLGKSTL